MLPTDDSPDLIADAPRSMPAMYALPRPNMAHSGSPSTGDATPEHDDRPHYGDEVRRRRVQIYWSGNMRWFTGVVIQSNAAKDKHYILYEDGDAKWHDLGHEEVHGQLRWLDTSLSESMQEPEYPRVILRLREPRPRPAAPSGSLPAGVCPGGFCLAFGLHAGRRDQFKAKLLRVRTIAPEFLVRYIADVDGCTNELLLPEVRHAWLLASELAPWCEPICKRPPTAAKTRGQLVDRDADAAAARDGRVREASSEGAPRKRVRFSDEVAVIGFSQPCHDDDDDGGA